MEKDPIYINEKDLSICKPVTNFASAQEIVRSLTTFIRTEKEERNGKTVEYIVVKCPKGQYCKNSNAEIRYQNKTGFKNPFSHLRSCLAQVCRLLTTYFCSQRLTFKPFYPGRRCSTTEHPCGSSEAEKNN